MVNRHIPFSPPEITDKEITAVGDVLKSGWITTGPKVAKFEYAISQYCGVKNSVVLGSATTAMEVLYKTLDLKVGAEVLTTPYTYTATSSSLLHRGIRPVFVDVKKDSFIIDEEKLAQAITPNTKLISTVDFAGVPVDYDKIKDMLSSIGRKDIVLMSDSAHALGASYKGNKVGGQFDFHVFSFHAVKNLTTAEGGAITFNDNNYLGKENIFKEFKLQSLNGQSKDAFSKMNAGAWKYDILTDGYKCNMTDIQAAIGLVQLERYQEILGIREGIFDLYTNELKGKEWAITPFKKNSIMETSYHLYPLRIRGFKETQRDHLIEMLAELDIATNVHFIPLPMFTLYKKLGYDIKNYPNAYEVYSNEITLPLYSTLSKEDAGYVVKKVIELVEKIR